MPWAAPVTMATLSFMLKVPGPPSLSAARRPARPFRWKPLGARPRTPRIPRPLWRDAGRGRPGDRCGRRLDGRPMGEWRHRAREDLAGAPEGISLWYQAG